MPNHPVFRCLLKIDEAEEIVENFRRGNLKEDSQLFHTTLQDIEALQFQIRFQENDQLKQDMLSLNIKGLHMLLKFQDIFITVGFKNYQTHFWEFLENLRRLLNNESQKPGI